jgi:hypothetical protein
MSPSQQQAMACDHQWPSPLGMALPTPLEFLVFQTENSCKKNQI